MKKAALAVLLLGAALCIPGCGFEEGAGAVSYTHLHLWIRECVLIGVSTTKGMATPMSTCF